MQHGRRGGGFSGGLTADIAVGRNTKTDQFNQDNELMRDRIREDLEQEGIQKTQTIKSLQAHSK